MSTDADSGRSVDLKKYETIGDYPWCSCPAEPGKVHQRHYELETVDGQSVRVTWHCKRCSRRGKPKHNDSPHS